MNVTHDEWHKRANELFKKLKLLDGDGYKVEHGEQGQKLFIDLPKVMQQGGGSSSYSGPFAVAKLTDTSIEVIGYSVADSQYWNNYIIAGLSRLEITDATSVSVTASGYTYIEITYASRYVATLAHAAALPAQDATHIYVPLAYVVVTPANGDITAKISKITQIQYGIIHFPARAG